MNNAGFQHLLAALPADRGVYPHQYNLVSDQLLLVRLDEKVQSEASFLDDRVLPPQAEGAWFTWTQVKSAAQELQAKAPGYIFHMGHCGSTLLSRLVSEASGAVAMREPLPLRALAIDASEFDGAFLGENSLVERLGFFEACWARGEAPVVVKATSMCTGLAGRIGKDSRKLFIFQKPETHLAALLSGQNTMTDLRGFAQMRHRRLRAHFDAPPLADLPLGELAAMSWACEAADALGVIEQEEMAALDFDAFLKDPAHHLGEACVAVGLEAPDAKIAAALSGPIMKTYSKAPEHQYSAGTRAEIIAQSKSDYRAEITAGMKWLESAAGKGAALAKAVERFGGV